MSQNKIRMCQGDTREARKNKLSIHLAHLRNAAFLQLQDVCNTSSEKNTFILRVLFIKNNFISYFTQKKVTLIQTKFLRIKQICELLYGQRKVPLI